MQTEPEQWAVVQEVETVTGDFLTEPGVPFYRIVIDGYCADFDHRQAAENFVAAIQRAFEERERKLREAASKAHLFACCFLAFMGRDRGTERQNTMLDDMCREASDIGDILRQALKETPDAG